MALHWGHTFVVHSEIVLGQSDGVALVQGAPEPWQWRVLFVYVRVELLETVQGLILGRGIR